MTAGADLHFFPLDVTSDVEFAAIYAVLALLFLLIAKTAQRGVLALFERGAGDERPDQGYRHAAKPERRLTVGVLPNRDDLLHIGYLRAGLRGMTEAVVAGAMAEGWVGPGRRQGRLSLNALPNDAAATSRELAAALHATEVSAEALTGAAERVARAHRGDVRRELEERGLVHTSAAMASSYLVWGAAGGAVVLLGGLRLRSTGAEGSALWVAPVLVAVAGAVVVFGRTTSVTRLGRRYLEWLQGVTQSLRHDVGTLRTQRPQDHALIGALAGPTAVPLIAALIPAVAWGAPPWVSFDGGGSEPGDGASCGGSACSASGCGGGGGCGSGGCGGGGGCGS